MKWSKYYENVFDDWTVEKMISQISKLVDIGTPEEVMDVLHEIGYVDKEGASKLLEKALEFGMQFSVENLSEIQELCSEAAFWQALEQAAPGFTQKDLEEMYNYFDDELIIEVANKLGVSVPQEMEGAYEKRICTDTSTPISWDRFYENYAEWSVEYAKQRCRALTEYGSGNQILEVAENLFYEDQGEADEFIERAVEAGATFGVESLLEISALCSEETTNGAFSASIERLTKEDLEALRCGIDDDVIIETAKKCHHDLTQSLKEIDPEEILKDELKFNIEMAVESADYALQCLCQAQIAMNRGSNASLIDLFSKSRGASFFKHLTLGEAEQELRIASKAVSNLNQKLSYISGNQYVKFHSEHLTSLISLWFDDDFLNCMIHLQIDKVQKNIRRAITRVEDIRRELAALWNDMQ